MRFVEILRGLLARVDTFGAEDLAESTAVLVHLLTKVGKILGVDGILRHYKWREVAMAGILKHRVFAKTSTGGGGEGVGFAVPVDAVRRSLDALRSKGHVDYAYLGVTTQELWPQLAQRLGLPVKDGALVASVDPGGPAAKAGYVVTEATGNLAFIVDRAGTRIVGITGGGSDLDPSSCTG